MKGKIPLAAIDNAFKKYGIERIGESAKSEMQKILYKKAQMITETAIRFSRHAGRKTLKKEDIELSIKP